MKLLEENIGGNLLEISFGNDFLNFTTKAKATKARTNNGDSIRLKSLCTSKGIINEIKNNL